MSYTEIKHPQYSTEWWDARNSIPTGSEFKKILCGSPSKVELLIADAQALVRNPNSGLTTQQQRELVEDLNKATKARKYARYTGYKPSDQQDGYIDTLLDEGAGPMPQPGDPYYVEPFQSDDMKRGSEMEPIAREWLRKELGEEIRECGFLVHEGGKFGCSPDGLREVNGIPVEIKSPVRKTLIKWWRRGGTLPSEHKAQCHGHMITTKTDRCLFLGYSAWDRIQSLVIEVRWDDYTNSLEKELGKFCTKLEQERRKLNL